MPTSRAPRAAARPAQRRRWQERLATLETQHAALLARVQGIGFIWKGTVTRQRLTCGNPRCACHTSAAARHGPYAYWTSKVRGKTVSRLLDESEAQLLEEWIENRRRIDQAVKQMAALAKKAAPLARKLRESETPP